MPDLKACRVLVTPTSYAQSDPRLRSTLEAQVGDVVYNHVARPLSSAELVALVPGCGGFIAGVDAIDRPVIEAAEQLKVIARYGAGVDNVDLEAARKKGIVVTNTPGANSLSVAELTVGLILALARSIPSISATTKAGEWPRVAGFTLQGKVIGLLGLGAIGRGVARRLAGFECIVAAHDPVMDPVEMARLGVRSLPIGELARQSDFLSLHVPLLPDTRGMINKAFLKSMKPGAFLINTARGELVDEAALADALRRGRLRGAALDVFQTQPPGAGNPLLGLPQVIATPHMGAHTDGAMDAMGWGALNDCLAVLRGEEPAHRVV